MNVASRGLWQTWLAFLPTLVLAGAGLWWIVREVGRAEADAASVAAWALDAKIALPELDGELVLGGEAEGRFVYADPPVQGGNHSGFPEEVLKSWEESRGNPSAVPTLLEEAVGGWPSVLTPVVLRRAAAEGVDVSPWRQRWEADEAVRDVLRREGDRLRALEGIRWFATSDGERILFRHDGDTLSWWEFGTVEESARAIASSVADKVPNYLAPAVMVAGETIVPRSPGKILARMVGEGMAVELALVDRAALLDSVRRQLWLPGGAVVAAFVVGLVGFLQSRRVLRREFALGQAKSDFVSSVSHELRAPVASVRLLAERMADGKVVDAAQLGTYARFIRNETRRLGALIENVLDVSRIEQGRKDYHFEEADVAALARDVVELMNPVAEEKGIGIEAEIPAGEVAATLDPLGVRQALINLIDNAIKHAPAGSAIRVGLEAGGRTLTLSVSDFGPGIAAGEQGRIFDRFYRIGSEIDREFPGAGIGLSLVKHTAEAHGGRVGVESRAGEGSTFSFVVPRGPAR